MNLFDYIKTRNNLISAFDENFKLNDNETMIGQFNMVSASLSNFLPEIDPTRHFEIYKNILLHKKLSILEQSSYDVLNYVVTENFNTEIVSLLKNRPTVICTFHTGSYRIINLLLAKYNIPYTLVIGKEISEKEGELFSALFQNLPGSNEKGNLKILNAENSKAGLKMLRELKQGRTLVLYIDGNSGSGTTTMANENHCKVGFLQQQIFARKGIAYLAHVAGVPIVSVASYRKSMEDIRLHFFDPIFPNSNSDRNEFAHRTTQYIYDLIAPLIKSYPEQWEGWLYIHKVANITNLEALKQTLDSSVTPTEKITFNSHQFGIFKLNSIPFLLKKSSYSFYEVNVELYDLLTRCIAHPERRECFDNTVFHQLYEQGVLVYK